MTLNPAACVVELIAASLIPVILFWTPHAHAHAHARMFASLLLLSAIAPPPRYEQLRAFVPPPSLPPLSLLPVRARARACVVSMCVRCVSLSLSPYPIECDGLVRRSIGMNGGGRAAAALRLRLHHTTQHINATGTTTATHNTHSTARHKAQHGTAERTEPRNVWDLENTTEQQSAHAHNKKQHTQRGTPHSA